MAANTDVERAALKLRNLLSTPNRLTRDRSLDAETERHTRAWKIMRGYLLGAKGEGLLRFTALMRALDLPVAFDMIVTCDERAIHLAGPYGPLVEKMQELRSLTLKPRTKPQLAEARQKIQLAKDAREAAMKNPDRVAGYAAGLEAFREAAEAVPNDAACATLYGYALHQTGRYAEATRWLQEAVRCNGLRASSHFHLAQAYRANKCYASAMAAYHRALVLQPLTWNYALEAGQCLLDTGDLERAVPYLQHAARVGHDVAQAHCALARTLLKLKRFEESLGAARKAVEVMPSSYDAQSLLGSALFNLNRWREARPVFVQALLLKPNDVYSLRWIGGAWVNEGRPEQAVEPLRKAVQLAPNDTECRNALAWALFSAERHADALPLYLKLMALEPRVPHYLNNLGQITSKMGNRQGAIQFYRQALAVEPGYTRGMHNLIGELIELGEHEEALALAMRIIKEKPRDPGSHNVRARVLHAMGRGDEAALCRREAEALR